MTVLVTGATGRLGQSVVARLLAEGRAVRVLTRRLYRALELFANRLPIHEWHPLSQDVPPEAVDGISGVAHLMGEPIWGRPTAARLERIRTSRLVPTTKLAAAVGGRASRLVVASVPILDFARSEEGRDETHGGEGAHTLLQSVAQAHELAASSARAGGCSVAAVRLGLLLSPDAALTIPAQLADRRIGLNLKGARIPAIDIEDASALIVGLLNRPELEGPVHGVAPMPLYGEDLMHLLTQAGGAPPRIRLPRRLARRWLGELTSFLYNGQAITPRRLLEAGAVFLHPDPKASAASALAQRVHAAPVFSTVWPITRAPALE